MDKKSLFRKSYVLVLSGFYKLRHIFLCTSSEVFPFVGMLVLYETALGYCLFKLTADAKLNSADLYQEFETPEQANSL